MLQSRQVAWPAYLVCAALIFLPLADVATSLYPWRFVDARWRFAAVGLVSSALLLPMVGMLIAFVTAATFQHRAARRVIGVLGLLAGAVSLLALASFSLDALQTRATVTPAMKLSFNVASITAAVKTLLASVTLLAIGWSAIRDRGGRASEAKQPVALFKVEATRVS